MKLSGFKKAGGKKQKPRKNIQIQWIVFKGTVRDVGLGPSNKSSPLSLPLSEAPMSTHLS